MAVIAHRCELGNDLRATRCHTAVTAIACSSVCNEASHYCGCEAIEYVPVEQLRGGVDPMRESRIARARGLAQAIAECRDDARLDGIREGAAEIVTLLGGQ